MRDAGSTAPADDPGFLASSVTTLRLIAGWACTALGVLNLSMGIDTGPGTTDGSYVTFHAVLSITGLVLLGWRRTDRRPHRAPVLVGTLVAVVGPVLSALPATTVVCCLSDYPVRHGFPFTVLARGGGWHVDGTRTVLDLIFWVCAGFLTMVAVALVQPAGRSSSTTPTSRAKPAPAPVHPAPPPATHAEKRAAAAPAPRDENVGGLP